MKKHPHADRPLINYDVTLLLQPTSLIGVLVGVLINAMTPNWLIVLLSAIILTILSLTTFIRAIRMWRAETAAKILGTNHSSANYHQIADNGDTNSNEMIGSDDESETFDRPNKNGNQNVLETSLLDEDQLERMEQETIEKEERKQHARNLIQNERYTPFTKLFV